MSESVKPDTRQRKKVKVSAVSLQAGIAVLPEAVKLSVLTRQLHWEGRPLSATDNAQRDT